MGEKMSGSNGEDWRTNHLAVERKEGEEEQRLLEHDN